MSKGGVLLLHDYYNSELPGVKKAVDDFELKLGRKTVKIPSCSNMSFSSIPLTGLALIKD